MIVASDRSLIIPQSKKSGRLTGVIAPEVQWFLAAGPTETGVESNIHSSSLATCDLLMSYHSCKMNMNKWEQRGAKGGKGVQRVANGCNGMQRMENGGKWLQIVAKGCKGL